MKNKLTYSMLNSFKNCRKSCEYRYLQNLKPKNIDPNLYLGSTMHKLLEEWHTNHNFNLVLETLNLIYKDRREQPRNNEQYLIILAMMKAYIANYEQDPWDEVIALEKGFIVPIVNPGTKRQSRNYEMAGKIDGIVRIGNEFYVLEHKTTALINEEYENKLWSDFQISLYVTYIEKYLNISISGVIYNILQKPRIKQRLEETDKVFAERVKSLLAKSKKKSTTARQRQKETDQEFTERLDQYYIKGGMFLQKKIYISLEERKNIEKEVWTLAKAVQYAKKNKNFFYRNTAYCFKFGKACSYLPLCANKHSEIYTEIAMELYDTVPPHEELSIDI